MHYLAGQEIGVTEAFGVIEQRDHGWQHAKYAHFGELRHRQGEGDLRWILLHQQAEGFLPLGWIIDHLSPGTHRDPGDIHHLWRVMIDCQRDPIVSCDVRRLLTIESAEKVKPQALVRVTDRGRLRPAILPQRGDRHDAVLIEQSQNLRAYHFVH